MKYLSYRLYFTVIITITIWTLLVWDHYHNGVVSHHLLNREDLPKISNWWNGLLLPLFTLLLTYRIQKRVVRFQVDDSNTIKFPINIICGFLFSLLYGILISLFFHLGYSEVTGYLFKGIILFAIFFPIYRAEYLLGFVLGMTLTFGAVLSTAAGLVFVIIGLILNLYVRRIGLFLINGRKA